MEANKNTPDNKDKKSEKRFVIAMFAIIAIAFIIGFFFVIIAAYAFSAGHDTGGWVCTAIAGLCFLFSIQFFFMGGSIN